MEIEYKKAESIKWHAHMLQENYIGRFLSRWKNNLASETT
jgi:hypothetical protein